MAELTAIKVKIGQEGRKAKYPEFNTLQVVIDSGIDWSYYLDQYGTGWIYDRKCGHKEDSIDSPLGTQYGVIAIPDDFATQAVVAFPDAIEIINEEAFEIFHDERCTFDAEENIVNESVLNKLKKEQDLIDSLGGDTKELKARTKNALNPFHDQSGIKKNHMKHWKDRKALQGITIKVV